MNIGKYQFVWWSPFFVDVDVDPEDPTIYRSIASIRRPCFWKTTKDDGIYSWRVLIGWLEVRRWNNDILGALNDELP